MNPEYIGMTASVIILLAGCMQSEKMLRTVDIIGSCLMIIYGVIINSLSVVVLNTGLTVAHIYRLLKIKKRGKNKCQEVKTQTANRL